MSRFRYLWPAMATLVAMMTPQPDQASDPAKNDRSVADQLPRIPAKEPADALASFTLQHGFAMQLVASEPDVVDPVDAAFDENGRLWVAEMRGYPYPEPDAHPIGRVRVLSDNDDDGRFETSQILAEDLYWPTGIAIWNGGCFVIAAPDILYLKDTDNDGKADVRQVVFTGFDRKNVQALANNLKWGVDNRIYGASSSNGGDIRPGNDPNADPVSVRGRDFSFDPRTREFSQESGTAQFGNSFDDWYDRFVCSNSDHAIQIVLPSNYLERNPDGNYPPVVRSIAKEGGAAPVFRKSAAEPWRVVRTARRAASGDKYAPTELFATGFFTSASGITVYRGDAYPSECRGDLFIGDVGGNLIHRKKLEPNGTIFSAIRADEGVEFVTSTDNWFRPVNFVNGPDGCLYILDMYRETIEHPWSIPEDIKSHLDLESGRDRGRIYRLAPPDFKRRPTPKLNSATTAELVSLLGHANAWHRESAQRLLIERADPLAPELLRNSLAASTSENTLQQLHVLWTLRGLENLGENDLLAGLSSSSPRVREHALRLSEGHLAKSKPVRDKVFHSAQDPDPRVRRQAAFTLGVLAGPEKAVALVRIAVHDAGDPYIRAAVLSSASDAAAEMLAAMPSAKSPDMGLARELARIVAARNRDDEWKRLAEIAGRSGPRERLSIVAGLIDGCRCDPGSLAAELAKRGIASKAWEEAAASQYKATALDEAAVPADRMACLRALRLFPSVAEHLYGQLLKSQRESGDLRLAALRELSDMNTASGPTALRESWINATPALRSEITEVMLARPSLQSELLDAIAKGEIPPAQLSPSARQRLLESRDPNVRLTASKLLAAAAKSRKDVVAAYIENLAGKSDPAGGRKVFERECAACHKLGEKGHEVGPNLATIRGRTSEQLVAAILDPNLEVLPAYVEYSVLLQDGRLATGMIVAESSASVTLRRAEGIEQIIPRAEIDEIKNSGRSLMPEGLEQKIKKDEMNDLVAFLLNLAKG